MPEMQDRLRRLISLREHRTRANPPIPAADFDAHEYDEEMPSPEPNDEVADFLRPLHQLVPGYEIINAAGLCYCTVQAFALEELRGQHPLGALLHLPPSLFHRYHPTFGLGEMRNYQRAAFIDTETTGHFVVRQFFMRNPAEEAALLVALADLLAPYEMTVTFNGRSFDLPLLRLRYAQNRRILPLDRDAASLLREGRPHLDLLMPARRVWRKRLQSCRLINLEQMILGLHRSEDDVPGQLIPELYHHYVRSGQADAMRRVFYHNHEDIVTMVALADHLSRAFSDETKPTSPSPISPANSSAISSASYSSVQGMDWAGLAHARERAGDFAQAEGAYTRALESVGNPSDRSDLLRRLAELYKKQDRWSEAAETWQNWITSIPGSDPTPYIELAKYCEWKTRDLEQAEMWTAWALHNLRNAHPAARRPADQRDLEHRLNRLQRKRTTTPIT
jgi:tetratricopeptide (TPR) repeat protein